ncbi:MAG: Na+/H+ antiporter NhaA [Desulfobacteraceae bacterium]|nr:MAG: Na+/H+ antiporter NhaA [Desulfobacteraceae bacterium]
MARTTPLGRLPIDLSAFQRFFHHEVAGSLPLFAATAAALIWANLSFSSYEHVWHAELSLQVGTSVISKSVAHWIDEALMVLFFFIVGLEIKYEILVGELASVRKALLPVVAAAGGMLVPAGLYAVFNYGRPTIHGWGIPMATDIAFALGVLGLLSKRIPLGLKVFLSALAIADDLGAVLVIAIFYTEQIVLNYLLLGAVFLALILIANRLWIQNALVYTVLGFGVWAAFLGSGVHTTVAGVLVAMLIPARGRYDTDIFIKNVRHDLDRFQCGPESCGFSILLNDQHLEAVRSIEESCHHVETPLQRLEFSLHTWVTYLIIPLFALANAGMYLGDLNPSAALAHPVTLGIIIGLFIGKPLGISLFALSAVHWFKIELPRGVNARHIIGAGCLGGIGFTMSLFISGLSFTNSENTAFAKLGILSASLLSAALGTLILFLGKKSGDQQ